MAVQQKIGYMVEPLNGSNYHNWKFRMLMLLAENDVAGCVNHEYVQDVEDTKCELDRKKENRAKNLIVQCVDDSQIENLRDKVSAYQMWKCLENLYEKKGLPGQLFLKRKLQSMKLSEGESVDTFLRNFDEVVRQLKSTGAELKDDDIICNLLLSLPKSFEVVVTVIENMPTESLTLEFVKSKLRAEEEKRMCKSSTTDVQSTVSPSAFSSVSQIICYECGRRGHIRRNCKQLSRSNYRGVSQHGYYKGFQGTENRVFHQPERFSPAQSRRFQAVGSREDKYQQGAGMGEPKSNYADFETQGKCEHSVSDCKQICFSNEIQVDTDRVEGKSVLSFCVDSGCTNHMIGLNDRNVFSEFVELKEPVRIAVAKHKCVIEATGIGNISGVLKVDGKSTECIVKNVFYVPNLRKNLLSVKCLENANIKVVFQNGKVQLYQEGIKIGEGIRSTLYELELHVNSTECCVSEVECEESKLWHRRLGHLSYSEMKKLVTNKLVEGMNDLKLNKVEFCEACVNGKLTRMPFATRTKSNRLLGLVHSDVCGPISPITSEGHKYFVTFIDDFSNFTIVYLLKAKSEVTECFQEYYDMTGNMFGQFVSKLRCDNGGEYVAQELIDFCRKKGVILDYTVPYTPEQNGKAERMNRSLVERARTMIDESGGEKQLWGEAVRTAVYVVNRSPTASVVGATPAEIWYGHKPNVQNLRVFGCAAYSHIPKELRTKMDKKAEKCILVGYAPNGYRLLNLEKGKIIVSRDVKFDENHFLLNEENKRKQIVESKHDTENGTEPEVVSQSPVEVREEEKESTIGDYRRPVRLPKRFDDYEMYMAYNVLSFVEDVPKNYDEVVEREDKEMWIEAMNREIESITRNRTWVEVDAPNDINILDTKWVYTLKPLEEKVSDQYKARLVARGFAQENLDYDDIYAPVARLTTIRTLLAVGNKNCYYFEQLDVKTAFLNSELHEDVYIYPPVGVRCKPNSVFKLNKSLYGLKQAPKCWNDTFNNVVLELGFVRSKNDCCLYYLKTRGEILYLLLYVDDIILASSSMDLIKNIKTQLASNFEVKDKGKLKHFLGLEICHDRENKILKINQTKYTQGILKRFRCETCISSPLPIEPKLNVKPGTSKIEITKKPFRELIGCLMYLMLGSRPDICFAVNYFSRMQDKATEDAWYQLKRVIRYLKGTMGVGLVYRGNSSSELTCFVDADWAGDETDRKSVSGFLCKVYGDVVSWVTRKQNCVALSTTEAELVALSMAVCECLWLKKLLCDLKVKVDKIAVYEDNQGCIAVIKNPENIRRVKHIDLKYHFVSENVKKGVIDVLYVESVCQQADILTKGLTRHIFEKNCKEIGLQPFGVGGC